MAKTYEQYTGDGVRTVYPADFVLGYFEKSDIYVYQGTDHTVQLNYVWQNDTTIELSAPITSGETMRIRRVVDRSQTINNYTDGAVLNEEQLDASFTQALMIAEEIDDGFLGTGLNSLADDLDAGTHSIHNVADAVDPQDVPSFNQLTKVNNEAAASAAAALVSEEVAAAAAAETLLAKDLAEAAAIVSVEAKDEFQDIYWGAYASEPILSPVGNPATDGDLYYNTTQNLMLVFNGSVWQEVASSVTGIRNEYDYTGAAGQSVFAAVYDIGFVDVYLNGVKLFQVTDYTASTGSDITLKTPLSDNTDTINITAYSHVDFTDGSNIPVTATGTTTPRTLGDRFADVANVKDFGAVGDGVTDDTAAITAAGNSGSRVFIPNGVYMISGLIPSNWTLEGETEGGTVLKLIDATTDNVLTLIGNTSLTLRNLTLDQNKDNQAGGHGIRFGGTDGVKIQNVTIQNAYSYAIGMQAGTNKNILIENLTTRETGQDGIDIKDYDLANENIVLSNITCINYGLNTSGQTAIDVRGPVVVNNLTAKTSALDTRAFRFRAGTVQGRTGSGVVNNISYTGAGDPASYAIQVSVDVRDYSISNVYCENAGLIALFEAGSSGKVTNIVGVGISGDALSIKGDGVIVDGLKVSSCLRGFDIEANSPNNSITNFDISGVTSGEFGRVQAGSTGFKLLNGKVEVGKGISFAEPIVVRDVSNYKTRSTTITSDVLVDTTGTKGFLVPHGLAVTPSIESIQLTLIRSTNNPVDEEIGYLQVEAVDSTNISGRLFVTLASGVAGAAVKVGIRVVEFDS